MRRTPEAERSGTGNTDVSQHATVYTDTGSFDLHLEASEIRWYSS